MRTSTLPGVLVLRRSALLDAFHSRWSLVIGALLVLSAAIARNYDGEDLRAELWWLAAPFAASLATSFILWTCFTVWAKPIPFKDYPRFLGVYWLTAPLAWLYGIPYERFLTPEQAVEANAWTLLAVSLWRVLIVARTLQILYGIGLTRTLTFTLAFGSITIFIATLITPRPVLDIMGGMRLPPEDRAAAGLAFTTGFFSLIGSGIFGLAALIAVPPDPTQPRTPAPPLAPLLRGRPTVLIVVATLAIAAWIPPLLFNQPLQRNRRTAEQAFKRNDTAALLAELRTHTPADYPPNWRLPGAHLPAHRRGERLAVLLPAITPDTPAWVRDGYTQLARDTVLWSSPFTDVANWAEQVTEPPDEFLAKTLRQEDIAVVTWLTRNDPTLTDQQRERLTKWLSTASSDR